MAVGYCYVDYPFGGSSAGRKAFRYTSRPVYAGEDKTTFSELISARVLITYNDVLPFAIVVRSDSGRNVCTAAAESLSVESSRQAGDYANIRKAVDVVPQEGCTGSFFQTQIDKTLHPSNKMRMSGVNYYTLPRPGLESEFIATGVVANG